MAESFAILGAVASISQFLSYGWKVLRELQGGKHEELGLGAEEIRDLAKGGISILSERENAQNSKDEEAIKQLATRCIELADKLMEISERLKVSTEARCLFFEKIRQSIRMVYKSKEIAGLRRVLQDLSLQLGSRIQILLQNDSSVVLSSVHSMVQQIRDMNQKQSVKFDLHRRELIELIESTKSCSLDGSQMGAIHAHLTNLSQDVRSLTEQHTLQSLEFDAMQLRRDMIPEAHHKSLMWIFENSSTGFDHWLRSKGGIYWVKGKAGSGKSTLMKLICSHEKTESALRAWASPTKPVTASFFFWNAGSDIQKSQVGLLRSLLYQILLAIPSFIPQLLSRDQVKTSWTREELVQALKSISEISAQRNDIRLCFFIDGLDEYESGIQNETGHRTLIDLLKQLVRSQNVKICVSSRPWNEFVDAFNRDYDSIAVENYTKSDIEAYVEHQLGESSAFQKACEKNSECRHLIPEITTRAQGVWLWVFLVSRDLLRDLTGHEDYPFLMKRLKSYPTELREYFGSILEKVDPIYKSDMAKIFLVTLQSEDRLPVYAYKIVIQMSQGVDDFSEGQTVPQNSAEAKEDYNKCSTLLKSRCRDLLHIDKFIIPYTNKISSSPGSTVDFLHRTVRDYLLENYFTELKNLAGPTFNTYSALCYMNLAVMDSAPVNSSKISWVIIELLKDMLIRKIRVILYYCISLERETRSSNMGILDELVRLMDLKTSMYYWGSHRRWAYSILNDKAQKTIPKQFHCAFLAGAIEHCLACYVQDKLQADSKRLEYHDRSYLLDVALHLRDRYSIRKYLSRSEEVEATQKIVSTLLLYGPGPTEEATDCPGYSLWDYVYTEILEESPNVIPEVKGWCLKFAADRGLELKRK